MGIFMSSDNSHEADAAETKNGSFLMHEPKKGKHLLAVIIAVGVLLSLLVSGIALYVERRYTHTDFEYAAGHFLAAMKTWLPWTSLAVGLLLTGLLSAYARLLLAHNIKTREFDLAQVSAEENLSKEIDERMWVEEALMQNEVQKQAILDGITANIVFLNKDLEILWANKSFTKFAKTPSGKLIGRKCHEFIGDTDKPCPECPAIKAFNGEKAEPLKMQTSEGTILEWHSEPIFDKKGKMIGVVEIGRDITEKAMLQRQLDQAHKMEAIGTLASGIAHEINTPTQYVGDNLRFLQDAFNNINDVVDKYSALLNACEAKTATEFLVEDVKKLIEKVDLDFLREEVPKATNQSLEGIERVTKIVRAMKDFAHPGPEEKALIDLNKAINSTITVARNEWKYVSEVVTEFDPELPAVPCLAGDFNQVILNLIVNASHAIGDVIGDSGTDKGTITISTIVDGDFVEVRVKDTGKGIPEDIAPRIFDPFFTTKEVGKGSGQGLAIAHDVIANKLGGSITFETEVGKGTTFIIRLPLIDSASAETDDSSVSEESAVPELIG